MSALETLDCPYCDAVLNGSALSCRCCGRDLTPVLPLLRRIGALEARFAALEITAEADRLALPAPVIEVAAAPEPALVVPPVGRRRFWALPLGFLALLAAYWTVVLWLDLPLYLLRLVSIAIPFVVGFAYFGARPRLTWLDAGVAAVFALVAVAAMNALLGWIDQIPIAPQGAAAWRETFFYALSIGASMLSGMLLRVTQAALAVRGLTSIPRLREGLATVNGKVPMDTLKAIELTILLVGTVVSAITGLLAGILGVTK